MNTATKLSNGLWHNNPAMVQLLGLCPLLAISNSVINAFIMGVMTIGVLLVTALLISSTKKAINPIVRLPIFMLVIASSVTFFELLLQLLAYDYYIALGIFIPLIVTNCLIIGRTELVFSRASMAHACLDALYMGIGFTWVLILLGGIREILSQGTLFSGFASLFGASFEGLTLQIAPPQLALLASTPAGAFIIFGVLLAIKQAIDAKINQKKVSITPPHLIATRK